MHPLTLKDLNLKGKRVLMRVDFNVPLDKQGEIVDDTRIREALPSIQYILEQGGSLVLMSHLGRPKGRDPSLSLAPCARRLGELLSAPVAFIGDCIGEEVERKAKELKMGSVLLLENVRFYPAEEKPDSDPLFAEKLSKLGDFYVDDAFGAAHRRHSSTYTIVKSFSPGRAAIGLLMEKEMRAFDSLLVHPKRPFYAMIGGAKISSKIGVLTALISKVDALFVGGAMAYTFFKAKGIDVGASLFEKDFIETAQKIMDECSAKQVPLFLPIDHVIAEAEGSKIETQPTSQTVPTGWKGMDIGPLTVKEWSKAFSKAATIFWNGPLGVVERPPFAVGTNAIAHALANLSAVNRIVGGGDSVAAINALHLAEKFTHISTGGGASLEYLELGHLPGIDILTK
jgi:phosphoglycerate kinase